MDTTAELAKAAEALAPNEEHRTILIGLGSGTPEVVQTLLEALGEGTADLFRHNGVIDRHRTLTSLGEQLASAVAADAGLVPDYEQRLEAAAVLRAATSAHVESIDQTSKRSFSELFGRGQPQEIEDDQALKTMTSR